jgi:hypothetical protein
MKLATRILAATAAVLLFSGALPNAGLCQGRQWSLTVTGKPLNNYLNYQRSSLTPVTAVLVDYDSQQQHLEYETFCYSHGRALGCRQHHPLELQPGTAGIIRIAHLADFSQESARAAANAVLRTLVEVHQKRAILQYVAVPSDSFETIIAGFESNGFRRLQIRPDEAAGASVTLTLIAEPTGQSIELGWNGRNGSN